MFLHLFVNAILSLSNVRNVHYAVTLFYVTKNAHLVVPSVEHNIQYAFEYDWKYEETYYIQYFINFILMFDNIMISTTKLLWIFDCCILIRRQFSLNLTHHDQQEMIRLNQTLNASLNLTTFLLTSLIWTKKIYLYLVLYLDV